MEISSRSQQDFAVGIQQKPFGAARAAPASHPAAGFLAPMFLMGKLGVETTKQCKVVPQFGIAKLVNITPITMVYGKYNYSINGVYKPTNITGGHHPVGIKPTLIQEHHPISSDISSYDIWACHKTVHAREKPQKTLFDGKMWMMINHGILGYPLVMSK